MRSTPGAGVIGIWLPFKSHFQKPQLEVFPHPRAQVSLIYANVTEADILMKKELDIQARVHGDKKFALHYVLNDPPAGEHPRPLEGLLCDF